MVALDIGLNKNYISLSYSSLLELFREKSISINLFCWR